MSASTDFIPDENPPEMRLDYDSREWLPESDVVAIDINRRHVSRVYVEASGQEWDDHMWYGSVTVYVHSDNTFSCAWCGESWADSFAVEVDGGACVCHTCDENHAVSCEAWNCGVRIHEEDSVVRDDCYFCQDCDPGEDIEDEDEYDDYESGSRVIEPYGHLTIDNDDRFCFRGWAVTGITVIKRVPARFPAIGFELETNTDDYRARDDAARFMLEGLDNNYLIIKEDGSVSGFEMVTMPADYRAHLELFPWDKLPRLGHDYAMRSWNGSSGCGLHVHISKSAFTASHIWKFVNFHDHNIYPLVKLAGRKSDQWARFGKGTHEDRKAQAMGHMNTDRYVAVNTNPRHTYELRYFRGSLRPDTVKAAIEFTHALWLYTRDLSVADVRNGALLTFDGFGEFARQHTDEYPHLLPRLVSRGVLDN